MKRDPELIRKMLLAVEALPKGFAPKLDLEGHTPEQVGYHAYLLIEAGYAKGAILTHMASPSPEARITSLTWKGHDFLEAARDPGRWEQAMKIVKEKGGGATLDVLKDLLVSLMTKAMLGS